HRAEPGARSQSPRADVPASSDARVGKPIVRRGPDRGPRGPAAGDRRAARAPATPARLSGAQVLHGPEHSGHRGDIGHLGELGQDPSAAWDGDARSAAGGDAMTRLEARLRDALYAE